MFHIDVGIADKNDVGTVRLTQPRNDGGMNFNCEFFVIHVFDLIGAEILHGVFTSKLLRRRKPLLRYLLDQVDCFQLCFCRLCRVTISQNPNLKVLEMRICQIGHPGFIRRRPFKFRHSVCLSSMRA